jgi:lysophospholipase L1-like esterase
VKRTRAVLVAAAALLALELSCRLVPSPDPLAPPAGGGPDVMLKGNPWLLWELAPGTRRELGVTVGVNPLGFRDAERPPKSGPRAMVIGDSSIYGFGVEDRETMPARLEAATGVPVVNAGVPGYSTFQALNALRMRGLDLEPDLLIVATLWSDNNFDAFVDRELLASYAGWQASGTGRARALLGRSALFRRLDWTLRVAPRAERARKVGWTIGNKDPTRRDGRRRVALADYAANLDAFCTIMAERGGGVAFLILPNREDVAGTLGDPAWAPYREAMAEAGRRCGAPVVDGPAAFRADGQSGDTLFLDLMHPTRIGQGVLAAAVAEALEEAGWPGKPMRVQSPAGGWPPLVDRFEGKGLAPR